MSILSLILPEGGKHVQFLESELAINSNEGTLFLDIDVTISSPISMTAEITKNPIEKGSVVSDNMIIQNRMLTIEGAVTQAPLTLGSFGIASVFENRPKDAYDVIKALWENKYPFAVIHKFDKLSPVFITEFQPRNIGDSLRFTAKLEEVKIIESVSVELPPESVASDAEAATTNVKKGKQVATTADSKTADNTTAAFDIYESLR